MKKVIERFFAERRCRQGALPDQICRYIAATREFPPAKTPLEEVRFVVLDTETTGLNPEKDYIISIGAVAVIDDAMRIDDSLDIMLKAPDMQMSKESIEVHEILPGQTKEGGLPREEGLRLFAEYLSNSVIVAHHAEFDSGIINAEFHRCYGVPLFNPAVDTVSLTHRIEQGATSYNSVRQGHYTFDNVCSRYSIPAQERHTAAGDAFATALLFMKLLRRLRQRKVHTLGDLLR